MVHGNMQADEHRKDSGVDWLGEIPGHWEIKPGLVALSENKRDNKGMKETQVLSLSYGNIIVKPEEKLTGLVPESFETYQVVEPGDIIVRGTDLQNDQTSLRTGLAKDRGIITNAYLGLRVKNGFNPAFVHYYLHALDTCKILYKFGSGLRQNLGFEDFKRLPIVEVPTDEQDAIVRFLDEKTAKVDAAIALEERQIALLKERKQIIIHNAVTKGLNPDAAMKDSGVDWIGEMPVHWELKPIRALFCFRNEKNDPVKTENILSLSIAHGVTPYSEEGRGGNKRKDDITAYKIARPEDIVLNSMNVIVGAVGLSKYFGAISPVYYALYKRYDDVHINYFSRIFSNSGFQKGLLRYGKGIMMKLSGTGQLNTIRMKISPDDLKCVQLPSPPAAECEQISSFISAEEAKIDVAIALKESQIATLKEYKATLINSAVTGKIKVA